MIKISTCSQKNGAIIIPPQSGKLACGEVGIGKMAEIEQIKDKIEEFFHLKNSFLAKIKHKKVIISGGATFESIDTVRFIGNYSSGKQSIYLAEMLALIGCQVIFVACNINLPINLDESQIIRVKNTLEMKTAIEENLENCNIFISCAAICDFIAKNFSNTKTKKNSQESISLELVKNIDLLHYFANHQKRPQIVVGFAAEDNNLIKFGLEKLNKKNCNIIVANQIDSGKIFGSELTNAAIITKEKQEETGIISKKELALKIVQFIVTNF